MCGGLLPESVTAGPDDDIGSSGGLLPESLTAAGPDDDIGSESSSDFDEDYVITTFDHETYDEYNYDESDDDYVDTDSESTIQSEKSVSESELNVQSEKLPSEEMGIGGKTEELDNQSEKLPSEEMGLVLKRMQDLPVPPPRVKGQCRWVKPYMGMHRVDTDGSVKRGKSGGYGAIIRNSNGELVVAASGVSNNLSVLVNQLMGVRLGLELAIEYKCKRPQVKTNSQFIYLLATFKRDPYEEDYDTVMKILADIYRMQNEFKRADFDFTIRGANQAADYLSKLFTVVRFNNMSEIKPEFHQKLIDIIASDAAGKFYDCLM